MQAVRQGEVDDSEHSAERHGGLRSRNRQRMQSFALASSQYQCLRPCLFWCFAVHSSLPNGSDFAGTGSVKQDEGQMMVVMQSTDVAAVQRVKCDAIAKKKSRSEQPNELAEPLRRNRGRFPGTYGQLVERAKVFIREFRRTVRDLSRNTRVGLKNRRSLHNLPATGSNRLRQFVYVEDRG